MAEPSAKRIWDAALGQLQIHVTRPNYDTWLRETVGLELADDRFIVGAPTEFVKEWLSTRMRSLVSQALDNVIGRPTEVSFQIIGHNNGSGGNGNGHGLPLAAAPTPAPVSTPARQRPNPKCSFASFVVGPSNSLAVSAALGAADHPGKDYNPLFIYSAPGLGKTHLLQAIALRAASMNHDALYVTSERFTNEFVTAIAQSRSDEFRHRYRSLKLLLIDDIQFLAGKERTQEEFFYTFNDLHAAGCQVVLANDRPPNAICGIESRLSSRFQWGLIADIQPPTLETRLAILQAKALEQQVELHPDVSHFLADRARHNIRELEGSLNRVLAYAHLTNASPITLDVATRALAALTPTTSSTPDPDSILRAVSSYFGITLPTLTSKIRTQAVADARHIAMFLLREDAHLSLKRIGLLLGHRDHATVIHGVQKVTHALNSDPLLLSQLSEIRAAARA
jgi:chromosomal replication initiator protein